MLTTKLDPLLLQARCPLCGAPPGRPCDTTPVHNARYALALPALRARWAQARCGHCHDHPPANHRCPACGATGVTR